MSPKKPIVKHGWLFAAVFFINPFSADAQTKLVVNDSDYFETRGLNVAYGNNRADYSSIAGGIVPGELILPPIFRRTKKTGPLHGERMNMLSNWTPVIFLVHAVNDLLKVKSK